MQTTNIYNKWKLQELFSIAVSRHRTQLRVLLQKHLSLFLGLEMDMLGLQRQRHKIKDRSPWNSGSDNPQSMLKTSTFYGW